MRYRYHRLLPLLSLLLATPALHAQVIVNEFMYYPDSSQNEWVELYNRGNETVSLEAWTIRDESTDSADAQVLSGSIPAGGYLIVARRPETFAAQYGPLSCTVIDVVFQQYNDNVGDAITIQDETHDTVDYVPYTTAWGKQRGHSMERIDPALPSQQQSSWQVSSAQGGTPCAANSVASAPIHQRAALPRVRLTDTRRITIDFEHPSRAPREGTLVAGDGRTAFATTLEGSSSALSCAGLPAGIYMLVISDPDTTTSIAVPVLLP